MLATGCDSGEDLAPQADPSGSTATPSPQATPQTADEALVDEVLERLAATLAVVTQARKAPLLRKALAPLVRAHRGHIEVLEGEPPDQAAPGPTPDPAAMLLLVRRGERDLQAELVDAAERAESGSLARVLASMSASVTQHLASLPKEAS